MQYLKFKGIKLSRFYAETGIKRGLLDSDKLKQAISDTFVSTIIATYDDVSLEWLLTGDGQMLKNPTGESVAQLTTVVTIMREELELRQRNIDILLREVKTANDKYFRLFEALNGLTELISRNENIEKEEIVEMLKRCVA